MFYFPKYDHSRMYCSHIDILVSTLSMVLENLNNTCTYVYMCVYVGMFISM